MKTIKKISKLCFIALACTVMLTLNSCEKNEISLQEEELSVNLESEVNQMSSRGNPVIHRVSVGGNDICESGLNADPGCDGNFSLSARMKADGTVTGQWQDTFNGGGEGIHVSIDCMVIAGNTAIIGGTVTHGTAFGTDVTGQYTVTKVVDNGTSNNDPADQISFSFFGVNPQDCTAFVNANFPLFDLTRGQVKVN